MREIINKENKKSNVNIPKSLPKTKSVPKVDFLEKNKQLLKKPT